MDDSIRIFTDSNRPVSLGSYGNREIEDKFNWIAAIDSWDFCDPTPLKEMILRHPIPPELLPIIADIVSGERKPKTKAAAKLLVPANQRIVLASVMLSLRSIPEDILNKRTSPNYDDVANEKGIEPSELIHEYRKTLKRLDKRFTEITGVSAGTVRNIINDLKDKIKKYPKL